ncbi:Predicted arabinose efflux permease, MFS family [Rhizobium sp. RU35A]|uniref:MFS transporter n=1 Tax=Rhizobium sp. RU35A TaxID=1907414 RepID=UPI000954030B|nr:MFS transporter [Rhizobium sp. RU35A]SIQ33680.1 Predicted arabinose efflux permease, MFS family [Rhizobium sp. RU35A]
MSGQKFGVAGSVALVIGHCAGMLDLVALPVWVGALVERYGFSPQEAGALATLFLLGAVGASASIAPRFNQLNHKLLSTLGFAITALAFFIASTQSGFAMLALLHLIAGISAGTALSIIHGTMGQAVNPHRLFAFAGIAIGLFAIILLAAIPQLLIVRGGPVLFQVFGGIMVIAALACGFLFSNPTSRIRHDKSPFSRATWLTIFGISIMTFNQSMVFSFVEVIGKGRGFEPEHVLAALIALGFVNFFVPSPLAALLQTRVSAPLVTQIGPAIQAVLAVIVTSATLFAVWAPAAAVFVAVQIFTHTFAFGRLATLDPTGRATAATPATLMVGAALGPIVGGALGENLGFEALGMAAVVVAAIAIGFFTKAKIA